MFVGKRHGRGAGQVDDIARQFEIYRAFLSLTFGDALVDQSWSARGIFERRRRDRDLLVYMKLGVKVTHGMVQKWGFRPFAHSRGAADEDQR